MHPVSKSQSRLGAAIARWGVDPLVFGLASLIAAAILVAIVAIPQHLSTRARLEGLRAHVGEVGHIAASVVDGDLHRQLLDPANYSQELYDRALAPLVKFHSADPDIFYVYTMADRGGVPYFVLDTATSPKLRTKHELRPSQYMEKFELEEDDDGQWLRDLAAGKEYITSDFEEDDYGTFLTAHVPIYDSEGRYSGFVGVDFDMGYYLAGEARFRSIEIASLAAALLLAMLIGYFVARYHATMRRRIKELHEISIQDSLTGFYNRRGAMEIIKKALERHVGKSAVMLVDIDNLSTINDTHGHVAGDAVIARTAEAVRRSLRPGDQCSRFGDEFMIYAPDCDEAGAKAIAERILSILSGEGMPLMGIPLSVSIGVTTCDGDGGDFARMHREAEAALRRVRGEGRNRIGIAPRSAECHPLGSAGDAA
jgi:diguanylate cyclase (GGDEF)-like protein